MSNDCIFCKIAKEALPSCKVYEDDEVFAFLDIAPIVEGHILVIPKKHHDPITDTPDDSLAHCIRTAKLMVKALQAALKADGASITQANGACAGQVVPHIHFHVVPRFDDQPFTWASGSYDSQETMQHTAERIKAASDELLKKAKK